MEIRAHRSSCNPHILTIHLRKSYIPGLLYIQSLYTTNIPNTRSHTMLSCDEKYQHFYFYYILLYFTSFSSVQFYFHLNIYYYFIFQQKKNTQIPPRMEGAYRRKKSQEPKEANRRYINI